MAVIGPDGRAIMQSAFGNQYRRSAATQPWEPFSIELDGEVVERLASAVVHPATPDVITAVVGRSNSAGSVARSVDGGQTWLLINESVAGFLEHLVVDPGDPNNANRVLVRTGGSNPSGGLVVESNDGGTTWAELQDPDGIGARVFRIAMAQDGQTMATGSAGVAVLDGDTLRASNQGFNDVRFFRFRVAANAPAGRFYGATDTGIAATNPTAPLWQHRNLGANTRVNHISVDPADPQHIFATQGLELLESADAGRKWTTIPTPAQFINSLGVSPLDSNLLMIRDDQSALFRSLDAGATWSASTVLGDLASAQPIDLLALSQTDTNIAMLGTLSGGVFATHDGGQTWAPLATPFSDAQIADIKSDPHQTGRFYVATTDAVWQTDDSGETWANISQGSELSVLRGLAVDPVVSGRIYALDNFQIRALDPRDGSWRRVSFRPSTPGGSPVAGEWMVGDPDRAGRLYYTFVVLWQKQLDSDDDAVGDDVDNCILTTNADQFDADGDGIGNACDVDIAPALNDCVVNSADLGAMRAAFFTAPGDSNWNPAADFNNDQMVNATDLSVMRASFFGRPGYSSQATTCR